MGAIAEIKAKQDRYESWTWPDWRTADPDKAIGHVLTRRVQDGQSMSTKAPEVVTLCGSTRFPDAFLAEQRRLALEGRSVISVGLFGHAEGMDMASQTTVDLDDCTSGRST